MNRLKLIRMSMGLTQSELADLLRASDLDRHQEWVSKIEREQQEMKASEAISISKIIGCDIRYLIADDDSVTSAMKLHHFGELEDFIENIASAKSMSMESRAILATSWVYNAEKLLAKARGEQ